MPAKVYAAPLTLGYQDLLSAWGRSVPDLNHMSAICVLCAPVVAGQPHTTSTPAAPNHQVRLHIMHVLAPVTCAVKGAHVLLSAL